jgi:hypothetical protein
LEAGSEGPLLADLRHGSFGRMHPTSRALILKLWSPRPEEIRYVPATEDDLSSFEKELGPIPEDFCWLSPHVAVESLETNGSMESSNLPPRIDFGVTSKAESGQQQTERAPMNVEFLRALIPTVPALRAVPFAGRTTTMVLLASPRQTRLI